MKTDKTIRITVSPKEYRILKRATQNKRFTGNINKLCQALISTATENIDIFTAIWDNRPKKVGFFTRVRVWFKALFIRCKTRTLKLNS